MSAYFFMFANKTESFFSLAERDKLLNLNRMKKNEKKRVGRGVTVNKILSNSPKIWSS